MGAIWTIRRPAHLSYLNNGFRARLLQTRQNRRACYCNRHKRRYQEIDHFVYRNQFTKQSVTKQFVYIRLLITAATLLRLTVALIVIMWAKLKALGTQSTVMEIERLIFSTLVLLNRWSYSDDASYIASIEASDYLRLSRLIFRIGVMSTPQLKELSITPQRFPSFQSG